MESFSIPFLLILALHTGCLFANFLRSLVSGQPGDMAIPQLLCYVVAPSTGGCQSIPEEQGILDKFDVLIGSCGLVVVRGKLFGLGEVVFAVTGHRFVGRRHGVGDSRIVAVAFER